jgi:putative addiction module component (TIGR02574 family)
LPPPTAPRSGCRIGSTGRAFLERAVLIKTEAINVPGEADAWESAITAASRVQPTATAVPWGLTPAVRGVTVTAMQLTPAEIERLSPEERLRLIEQLWDSLEDEDVALPPAQATELERRLATFDDDRADAVGWDELKAELTRRCP